MAVLVAEEAEVFSCGDVFGHIVEVECFGRVEVVGLDGVLEDGGVGFDGANDVGEDVVVEEGEDIVFF